MYYEIYGKGFPCILIAGLSADINWWTQEFINVFSQNFKTIVFDNRGAGRTDKPKMDYTIKMFADDTVGLMDVLNIEKAHVSGASMGGGIAQEVAINYPQRVEKLILMCTACGGSESIIASDEILQTLASRTEDTPINEYYDRIMPTLFTEDFISNNLEFLEMYKNQILKTPIPYDSYQRQMAAVAIADTSMRLKKIIAPTLILHGKEDILVPPGNAEILEKGIPNAKRIMLEETAHILIQPNFDKLKDAITKFLLE